MIRRLSRRATDWSDQITLPQPHLPNWGLTPPLTPPLTPRLTLRLTPKLPHYGFLHIVEMCPTSPLLLELAFSFEMIRYPCRISPTVQNGPNRHVLLLPSIVNRRRKDSAQHPKVVLISLSVNSCGRA